MAKQIIKLTIFCSGTTETQAERAALQRVASEISKKLEKTHSIEVRVVVWPDDFRPGVNTDPQREISRQIENQTDIYIGLMGARFGSPTPRAESGTQEEFEEAITKFRKDTTSIRILFYFKKLNQDLHSIDPIQLQKVQEFRQKVPSLGVLYRDFNDTSDFLKMVEDHIYDLIVEEWESDRWKEISLHIGKEEIEKEVQDSVIDEPIHAPIEVPGYFQEEEEEEDDEFYFLETIQEFFSANASLIDTLELISKYTHDIGEKTINYNGMLEPILARIGTQAHVGGSRDYQNSISEASGVLNAFADDLEDYANKMNPNVINFKSKINDFLNGYRDIYKFAADQSELENEETKKAHDSLESMMSTMLDAKNSMDNLQNNIRQLPSLTRKFKRASKHSANVVGQLVAELSIAINKGQEILSEIE